MTNSIKIAEPSEPIHSQFSQRWSPYGFSDSAVTTNQLCALFEAVRWTQSSYNEQPWRYIVARKEDPEQFAALLSCLVEGNQVWAKYAPVLALGIVSNNLKYNGKPNPAAEHDLGAASGALTMEALKHKLYVHQMIGMEPEKAREVFSIPDDYHALTGLAIGHPGTPAELAPKILERDQAPRQRHLKSEFVFSDKFGSTAHWLE